MNGKDHEAILELRGDIKVVCNKIDMLITNTNKAEKKLDTFITAQHKTCKSQTVVCSDKKVDKTTFYWTVGGMGSSFLIIMSVLHKVFG